MLRVLRALALVVVLVGMLGGGIAVQAQGSNTLIMARAADTTGLDPHTQTAFASL
ncbi:MAG: ABC transporter substrate-binding protein, partial [Anaerolineae bacterium]|nr:ABC transporter substrate-binding protein [Anaerolineae bacterium]